jgi:hypothetical protein
MNLEVDHYCEHRIIFDHHQIHGVRYKESKEMSAMSVLASNIHKVGSVNYLTSTAPESQFIPSHLVHVTPCPSELEKALRCILWHLSALSSGGALA